MNTFRPLLLGLGIVSLFATALIAQQGITDKQRLQAMKDLKLVRDNPAPRAAKEQYVYLIFEVTEYENGMVDFPSVRDANLKNIKYLSELKILTFYDTWVTDAGLAYLKDLPNLETLRLGSYDQRGPGPKTIPITDKGMEHVGQMKKLKNLELNKMSISDKGLAKLKPLTELEYLKIGYTLVTPEGIQTLGSFKNLRILVLEGNDEAANSSVINVISKMPKLHRLALSPIKIDPNLGQQLGKMQSLTYLKLGGENLRDADLVYLKTLQNLEKLDLSDSPLLTKEGLVSLRELKNLKKLNLRGSKLSGDDRNGLKRVLSNTEIYWYGSPF